MNWASRDTSPRVHAEAARASPSAIMAGEAECQQTLDLDMVDGVLEEEDEERKESLVWGRLFPLSKNFVAQG